MSAHGEGFVTWFSLVPGASQLPFHIPVATSIFILLIGFTFVAHRQLVKARQSSHRGLIPESKLTFFNFFDVVAEALYKLTSLVIAAEEVPRFYPLIGTIFLFIFTSNVVGLIPGFLPPTETLNVTLALGAFVFIYYNWIGFKTHGLSYLKHFMGPVWWLAPLIFIIEVISHLVRPVSLGLRLRGNIYGDHMVLGVFQELTPILVPVIFYGLGLFVAFIQAFVFTLLTMVYISLSTAHDH